MPLEVARSHHPLFLSMASQEEVYQQFDAYDWASFDDFQTGLTEILDNYLVSLKEQDSSVTSIPAAQQQQLTDQAKSFFFCSSTGHILNLDDYYLWKRSNGGKITLLEDPVQEPPSDEADAPYSSNYQNLVELIVAGKPVPGIKQIPDTVLSDQRSESLAQTRAKPWETSQESASMN